jgi:cellulose synthase/poly-beta-1,6-N-acetylglucosamine synthase-like glycosyltransferase
MSIALAALAVLVLGHVAVLVWVAFGVIAAPTATARRAPPFADGAWPSVDVIVPAHDEAAALPATLASLRSLAYPGSLSILVVDDRSTDGTAGVVRAAAAQDPRVRLVTVRTPSRRWAPKVHAVARGLAAGDGELVLTTDADCRVPSGWARAMAAPFADPEVVLVLGTVTTRGPGEARSFRERFEAIDWLTLMLTSRSMVRAGRAFASSANDQAYRRSAFERAGGFGFAGRAPSGDEDLLAQRLTRPTRARAVFLDGPEAGVLTAPMPSWWALVKQRRRWVSRYHHVDQYHPAFWLGIALLGLQSVALAAAVLALPFVPSAAPVVLGLWALKLAVEIGGTHVGLVQLGRRDLTGAPLVGWALLHPFFVATAVLASFVRPSSWHAGQAGYRRRLWASRWRRLRRRTRRRWQGWGVG